ncbi:MAG TPA: FMN-binding protein [Solirubrobacteraceae bacterium]
MNGRLVTRRAVPAALAGAAVVALLANVRARPASIAAPAGAGRQPPIGAAVEPAVRRVSSRRPTRKGPVRSATETATTPFSIIQLRVTLTGGELTRVETLELSGDNARTEAINARAEPILREEALKAGISGDIDVVSGATYTSRSYRKSLQAAIDRARARG